MKKLKKAISVIMAIVCLGALSGCSSSGNNLPMEERQFYLPHSSKSKLIDSKDDIIKQEGLKAVSYTHLDVYKRQTYNNIYIALNIATEAINYKYRKRIKKIQGKG